MKKDYKKFIFGFILGSLLFGSMGVAAITLTADKVTYTSSDSEFAVADTKTALDKLYELAQSGQGNIVELGNIGNKFDLTSYSGYENCVEDTRVGSKSASGNKDAITYDATTGIVTTNKTVSSGNVKVLDYNSNGYNCDTETASKTGTLTGKVYLIY